MWKLVCPIQGEWCHINNKIQAAEVYQYLLENYHRVRIRMIISNGTDIRGVRFKNRSKVEWFYTLAKNCGDSTGRFKVRIKEEVLDPGKNPVDRFRNA